MATPVERLNAALEGRYRIERQLGEGGMATVYLARDDKHNRSVALKVLKPELAAVVGAERFLAEIETTANLQHPHILPLFDSGEADSFLFYVMPYVEGESLRERLDREHQLPVEEAVQIAKNVAEALDYAHGQGVIHRDIKPANILLQAGKPVVSDFGIALALKSGAGHRLTETGLSLGTPHYMSPEQATGDATVGPATDVYALGCVLYEMLVGDPPFTGSTPQAILAKILTGGPEPVRSVRASVPRHVEAALGAAIERVPADRFTRASDFGRALVDPSFAPISLPPAGRRADRRMYSVAALAVFLGVLAAWGWLGRATADAPPGRGSRTSISLDGDHRVALAWADAAPLAISPDGARIAYVGESATGTRLYVRPLDSFEATPLEGTEGARQPFFSPDGQQLGYFDRRFLNRVPVTGGAPVRVAELPRRSDTERRIVPSGGAWGPGNVIVVAAADSVLWRTSLAAGERLAPIPLRLDSADSDRANESLGDNVAALELVTDGFRWPSFLPSGGLEGGPRVLAKVGRELVVVSVSDGRTTLTGAQMTGHGLYASTGHIIATQSGGQVQALPFNLETLSVTGPSVPILEDVFRPDFTPATVLAVAAESGTLVYLPGGAQKTVWLVDRGGRGRQLVELAPADYRLPAFSPDGTQLAMEVRGGGIRILDLRTGGQTSLPGLGGLAGWSPDGRELAFGSPPERVLAVPGAQREPFSEAPDSTFLWGWLEDGRLLLQRPYERGANGTGVLVASAGSGAPAEVLVDTEYNEVHPRWSPDGQWLVYVSDASGRPEVYLRETEGPGDVIPVSIDGGNQPLWSPSGEEILFWRAEELYSVRVISTEPLSLSTPELLFAGRYQVLGVRSWDISRTGDMVLMSSGPNWRRQINVIQNFFEELRQRVPN